MRSFDQPLTQPALAAQPALDAPHAPAVAMMIVAEQVQEAVERENAKLGQFRVARGARLTLRDAPGDYDISEKRTDDRRLVTGDCEAQNICHAIRAAVCAVERAHPRVG